MTDNPLDALRTLLQCLAKEAKEIGLDLHHAAIMPSPDKDNPDMLQAVFAITPQAVADAPNEEDEAYRRQFDEMMQADRNTEVQKKNAAAAEEVKGWLDGTE